MPRRAIDAILLQERPPYRAIAVQAISPVIGAEIGGVDLRLEPSCAQREELRRALLENHVLVFRDQSISAAGRRRLACLLGFAPDPQDRGATLVDEAQAAASVILGETWRADETWRETPPVGAVLHIHRAADRGAGGDMLFANMHLAYEMLSPQLKALLADLTAVHAPVPSTGRLAQAGATAEHPVVARHPATGRPTLFVNRAHTSHIPQLEPQDSDMTLEALHRHLEDKPVLTCRIRWAQDAVVVWDNRATQHLTLQDFSPGSVSGQLAPMAGDRPERPDA
jgi:taurine dioxygenase